MIAALCFVAQAHAWLDVLLDGRVALLLCMVVLALALRSAGASGELLLAVVMATSAGILAALQDDALAHRVAVAIAVITLIAMGLEVSLLQPPGRRLATAWILLSVAMLGSAVWLATGRR